MELFEAILSRRTIKDFTAQPVPAEVLDRALGAGLWAQNHRLTQPWRFSILGPATRQALADSSPDAPKILSKPLIVAVSFPLAGDDAQRREDYAAVCCAIQNIQLAAWADGLGMQWSTSKMIAHPATYALLGIDAALEEIIALLYFGYPAKIPPAMPRKSLAEVSRRLP